MHDTLADCMDKFAGGLLSEVQAGTKLEEKLAVLKAVGHWLAIKHAIMRGGHADKPPKRRGFQDDPPEAQRARALKRWDRDHGPSIEGDDSGPELQALRARLPHSPGRDQS